MAVQPEPNPEPLRIPQTHDSMDDREIPDEEWLGDRKIMQITRQFDFMYGLSLNFGRPLPSDF